MSAPVLTRRDEFAARVLQGFAANPEVRNGDDAVRWAFMWADALIAELDRTAAHKCAYCGGSGRIVEEPRT